MGNRSAKRKLPPRSFYVRLYHEHEPELIKYLAETGERLERSDSWIVKKLLRAQIERGGELK
jgi:hypothetical protein